MIRVGELRAPQFKVTLVFLDFKSFVDFGQDSAFCWAGFISHVFLGQVFASSSLCKAMYPS